MIEAHEKCCVVHRKARWKDEDVKRGGRDPFYGTGAWTRCRKFVLTSEPLCRSCKAPASVVDHIVPRTQGGADYDLENLQPLCERCHNRKRQEERA